MANKGTLTTKQIGEAYRKAEAAQKKEFNFWRKKLKLLSPKEGDILIVPAEALFDFAVLSEAIKLTPIKYALVVPGGNASLMSDKDALKFAQQIIKENGRRSKKTTKRKRGS